MKLRAFGCFAFAAAFSVTMLAPHTIVASASGPTPPSPPFAQCPAVGADASCGVLIVVNADRSVSVYSDPGVGPYDGGDDTLVGIQNDSSQPVAAIAAFGPSGLFSFDGDGVCTYSFAGNDYCATLPPGSSWYEGPTTSFVTDSSNSGSGEVDFAGGGLAANSHTYFSLELNVTAASLIVRVGHLHERLVVFVPGISQLDRPQDSCDNSKQFDPTKDTVFPSLKSHVAAAPYNATVKTFSYDGTLNASGDGAPYSACETWDSLSAMAARFQTEFDVWKSSAPRIDIVTHSLGGAVVGYWAAGISDADRAKLGTITTFESPLDGLVNWVGNIGTVLKLGQSQVAHDLRDKTAIGKVSSGLARVPSAAINNSDDCIVNGSLGKSLNIGNGPEWYSADDAMGPRTCSTKALERAAEEIVSATGRLAHDVVWLAGCDFNPICVFFATSRVNADKADIGRAVADFVDLVKLPHLAPLGDSSRWSLLDRMLKADFVRSTAIDVTCNTPALFWSLSVQSNNIQGGAWAGSMSQSLSGVQCFARVTGPAKDVVLHASTASGPSITVDGSPVTPTVQLGAPGRPRLDLHSELSSGDHTIRLDFGHCVPLVAISRSDKCKVVFGGLEVVRN